ncbi:hypothetical protein [Streptomyces rochei]|uniref:hypothetical protein n=1 Tax=Streptomyces rochei TaxID=1928 RepID=UPI00369A6053
MLEGYKPIDFGNLFANQPVDLGQVRNRVGVSQAALNILANSEFNKTPISTFLANGLNTKGEAPKRKQTLWGRVVDLLSMPSYAVANAADDALAGHQSSDTDSVLDDIGQVIGGVVTGAGRGFGTGLRGAFAGSETAADPMDKQYLGDFLIRWDTHMSAEDAMKPENREEVRRRLADKKINMLSDDDKDKYFYDWEKGRVEVSDEDIDKYLKDMEIYGLGASFVSDPLNFVKGPTGIFAGKGGAEVPELISGTSNTYEGFKSLPKGADTNTPEFKLPAMGKQSGSYKVTIPPGAIQNKIANPATGELVTPPGWFNFPKSADELTASREMVNTPVANVTDDLDAIINPGFTGEGWASKLENSIEGKRLGSAPVAEVPKEQQRIVRKFSHPKAISQFTGDLLKRAATGNFANALERISTLYPGVKFDNTAETLGRFARIPDFTRRLGNESERRKIFNALGRAIHTDVQLLAKPQVINTAERIINEAAEIGPVALDRIVEGAKPVAKSRNPTRDIEAVNNVYAKFEDQIIGSGTPSGLRNPAKWSAAVNAGKNVRYSGPQQVQMWNYITSVLLKNVKTPNRFAKANSILRQVEDAFMAKKAIPMSSFKTKGSVPLRLSQVLEAIGPAAAAMDRTLLTAILRGDSDALAKLPADVIQKIEEFKAGEAIVDASNMVKGIEAAKPGIEELIKGPLSAARQEEIVTIGSAVADDIARMAGGSPVAANKAGELLKSDLLPKAPGDGFPTTNTTALISHPDVSPTLLKKYSNAPSVAKAIAKAIDSPPPSKLGKLIEATGARVPEWLGARFNAAYKNADMRPTYLREAATAKATVALRAQYLNNLAKRYDINDADLWNDALKGAQGRLATVPGTQSDELAKEIQAVMENLFGSSGLKSSVALENSVVGRAQLFMKELNSNLKRFGLGQYTFSRGKQAKDNPYWEGTNWLNSWETWNIEKPLDFLFKIQNVVEHTVREKIMFDDLVARFGSKVKGGEFTHSVTSHPRLKGYYFGPRAAEEIEQFVKNLKDISHPSSKALQNFDKVLSKWKAGVTIYIPSHHIRNMIGDLYFNWLAGVNSTRPYGTALKVMQSQRHQYEGLEGISKLSDPNQIKKLMAGAPSTPAGKQTALTMRNGQHITNDMVYISAFQQGILPTTRVLEDIPDDVATGMEKIKPLGGRGQRAAHKLSEGRDHYVRLAHYIDALKKSNKSFEAASQDAAAIVRKWHPDGMDLTKFERNVMRRMFPFYSWTRKAFPLIVESLVATPGKAMVYPKGQYLLQNMLGIETGPTLSDPFPVDQLFPDWIREKGIGPIMGGPGDYTVINPSNPTLDIVAQLENPGKSTMGMINPAARIPFELASGTEVQTGAPLEGRTQDYLIKQIPGLSHAGRATGEFGVSETTKENSSGYNFQNIFNMLTAAGMQNTGPYIKSAEFDLRDYIRSLRGN